MDALSQFNLEEQLAFIDPLLLELEPNPVERAARRDAIARDLASRVYDAVHTVFNEVSAGILEDDMVLLQNEVASVAARVGEPERVAPWPEGPAVRMKWLGAEYDRLHKIEEELSSTWYGLQKLVEPILAHLGAEDELPDIDLSLEGFGAMNALYQNSKARLEAVRRRVAECLAWLRDFEIGPGVYEGAYYSTEERCNIRKFITGGESAVPAFQLLAKISNTLKINLLKDHDSNMSELARLSSLDIEALAPQPRTESESDSESNSDTESDPDGDSWTTQREEPSELHLNECSEAEDVDEDETSDANDDDSRSDGNSPSSGSTLDFVSPETLVASTSAVVRSRHSSYSSWVPSSPSHSIQLNPTSSDSRISKIDFKIRNLSGSAATPSPSLTTPHSPGLSSLEFVKQDTESEPQSVTPWVLNPAAAVYSPQSPGPRVMAP